MEQNAPLVDAVNRFIKKNDLSPVTFGRDAMRDPHFVRDLNNGRRVWPETEAKVRAFMAEFEGNQAHSPDVDRPGWLPSEAEIEALPLPNRDTRVIDCSVCDEPLHARNGCQAVDCPHPGDQRAEAAAAEDTDGADLDQAADVSRPVRKAKAA